MTSAQNFDTQAKRLIDDLKSVCANYGLGNDGNEFKIITQIFLYKFLNDKFAYEAKRIDPALAEAGRTPDERPPEGGRIRMSAPLGAEQATTTGDESGQPQKGSNSSTAHRATSWEDALRAYSADDYEMLLAQLGGSTAQLKPDQFLSALYSRQNEDGFAKLLDNTLIDIAAANSAIFSVKTDDGELVRLFEPITEYVASKRNEFARAIINKLVDFSFEQIFAEKFDFFATLFEYLIKDYNKDGGGKYAEYYTPHAVAKIMAACLVTEARQSVTCYDPSAGSGTLLMNLAHRIGEQKCSLFTEDISQKSSHLLRLNLILNGLVHSIPNVVQGNTILHPAHHEGNRLRQFDYIVSNPPFKLDFSDFSAQLDTKANQSRFFAGIPKVPNKKKESMAIYLCFLQHIIHTLAPGGKAAIVVPTGFITAQSGIDKKIRQHLVENKMLAGVVSMPSNIFATTGTNVSILFLDASNDGDVILVDASKLGKKVKDGKNQKTLLSTEEEDRIIDTFNKKEAVDDFSVAVSYDEIEAKNYSLSAGQYFEVKIEYVDITPEAFQEMMAGHEKRLAELFEKSGDLESEIKQHLKGLEYV